MFRKHPAIYIVSFSALFFVLACATTSVAPTQGAVSTTDPNAFSTMVAEAAGDLLTQTAEAQPASLSPTPGLPPLTETLIPTPTETQVTSQSGTSLSLLEDDSMQFIDNLAGIKLTIPTGWIAVRLNESEYFQIWELTAGDPVLKYGLESIQSLDPARYRLHAFNTQPNFIYQGEGSQISVIYVRDDTRTLEQVAEDEKQPQIFTEYALISTEFQIRPDGLELFIIEEQWRKTSSIDTQVMIYYKGAHFKVPSGTAVIELFVPFDISHEVVPVFDQMVERMVILIP